MYRKIVISILIAGCISAALAAETESNPETLLLKDFRPVSIYKDP